MMVRAEGRIKAAMVIISIGSILNICLDPVFIKVLGMGIEGAGIATVLSMVITSIVTFIYFLGGGSELSFNKKGLSFKSHLMKDIAPVGISGMAMQLMAVVQQIIIYKSVGYYGSGDDLAVIGATLNMFGFAQIPLWGISQGLQPIIGMNFGANKSARVKEAFNKFLLSSTGIVLVIWAVFMAFPEKILGLYITDPAVAGSGAQVFRIVMSLFFVQGFIFLPATLFQSIGKGKVASLLLLVREIILFVPIIIVLPLFMELLGIWISIPAADLLIVIVASILFIREFRSVKIPEPE
jgi:Na+-driven multidrug efflux pump